MRGLALLPLLLIAACTEQVSPPPNQGQGLRGYTIPPPPDLSRSTPAPVVMPPSRGGGPAMVNPTPSGFDPGAQDSGDGLDVGAMGSLPRGI
jgi:hypothetical protein